MGKYSLTYLIGRGFRNIGRNGLLTAATCIILVCCLLLTGSIGLLFYNTYVNINQIDGLNEIVCMCDYDISDDEVKVIEEKLKALENVSSVTFISKEEAFADQIKQYSSFPNIIDFFDGGKDDTAESDISSTQASTQPPKEDEATTEQSVINAISKRKSLQSYKFNAEITTEMLGIAVAITAEEYMLNKDGELSHLSETYLEGNVSESIYYKDGSLYTSIDGQPVYGEVDANDYLRYAEDNRLIMLYTVDFFDKFINYAPTQEGDGTRVVMTGINGEDVVEFFNIPASAIGEDSTVTVTSCDASLLIDKNGNITEEKFDAVLKITSDGADEGLEISVKYKGNLSEINALDSVAFDDDVLSSFAQTADLADKLGIQHVEEDPSQQTQAPETENVSEETQSAPVINEDSFDKNPLSDAFKVVYNDIEGISKLRDEISAIDGVRSVKDAADAARSLDAFKNVVFALFIGVMCAFVLISCIINVYTIKISIDSRQDEILVMRYVGATSYFISFPFMFESAVIGFISSIISYLLQFAAYGYLSRLLMGVDTDMASFISVVPFSEIWHFVLIANVFIAVVTSLIGCTLSTKKHIKV